MTLKQPVRNNYYSMSILLRRNHYEFLNNTVMDLKIKGLGRRATPDMVIRYAIQQLRKKDLENHQKFIDEILENELK